MLKKDIPKKKKVKNGNLKADWKREKNIIKMDLPVMLFKEKKVFIAYIPVLDISGYGNTETESLSSLHIVLEEYIDYTIKKNTLVADLKGLGWKISKRSKPFIAPELTDLISSNGYLHDIFNKRNYSVQQFPVLLPEPKLA